MPLYGPSGASEHLRALVRALGRAGHEVRVAVRAEVDDRGRWGSAVAVPVFVAPSRPWPRGLRGVGAEMDAAASLRAAVADGWRPDWVWERHALVSGMRGSIRARWLLEVNAPVVLERRAAGANVAPRVARGVADRLRAADRVVVVSTWLANHVVSEGARGARVRVVPNGVEPGLRLDRAEARARLPVPAEASIVTGFVGTFKPGHSVGRLPALVDALGPSAWLVTVGSGPVRLPAHPRIVGLGQLQPDAVAAVVAGLDVALAPYDRDSPPWFCPLKLMLYRAQGVPIVTGPLPDAARILGDDGGEIVVDGASAAWAAAVRRQAARSLRRQDRHMARRRVVGHILREPREPPR